MTAALAAVSLILGAVYTSYGILTIIDMKRGWKKYGFSHFGAAWIAMAFTCGPHHLEHGIHLTFAGRSGGWVELATVVVGVPAGAAWFLLRLEALAGGRGDRFISGTPRWISAMRPLAVFYFISFGATAVWLLAQGGTLDPKMLPNVLLVWVYVLIGRELLATQLRNRPSAGGWSVSGISLTAVFFTCAIMHGAWMLYAFRGLYEIDGHGLVIDWLAVPAAFYFLWVVRSLQLGIGRDWNMGTTSISTPERAAA